MTETSHPALMERSSQTASTSRSWTDVSGGWLAIGTSPGAILLGAGIAERYGGPIPFLSILLSFGLMCVILWFQGRLGLLPPDGEGKNFTQLAPRYFDPLMQRIVAALIALGMIGWYGFNVGLGGAALSALLRLPEWSGAVIIGLPILFLSMRGMKKWNKLASLTTLAVLILVGIIITHLAPSELPFNFQMNKPFSLATDVAVFIGYISVFSVRAPDFTAGLSKKKDLAISVLLLVVPLVTIALAGVWLQQGTGSSDLVNILAGSSGLSLGNFLITITVIAPTFTILYSGAPALKASIGLQEQIGMIAITVIGLILAISRFDLLLLSWLVVLAATLPPLVIPLAVESTRRKYNHNSRMIPIWVWLPGAFVSLTLTIAEQPFAALAGLLTSGLITFVWYLFSK
jgi:purine-cytosine permease-like protein